MRGDKSSIAFLLWPRATFLLAATLQKWCPHLAYMLWIIGPDCCGISSSLTLRGATVHVAQLAKEQGPKFFLGRFPGWRQCVGFTRCIMLLSSLQGQRAFVMSWLLPRSFWIAKGVNLQGPNWKHLKVKVIDQQSRQARSRCLSDRATSRKWTAFVSGFCKQRLAVLL